MSFFPIPSNKYGTKENNNKTVPLTNEVKKQHRERKRSRSHTINSVKKNSQKMEQLAQVKIYKIIIIQKAYNIFDMKDISLLAAKCVQEKLFDNATMAKNFIIVFKEKIFI